MNIQDIQEHIGVQFPVVLTKDAGKRAKAGAKFMDLISKGIQWVDDIALTPEEAEEKNIPQFFIGESNCCVLGSVFPDDGWRDINRHLFDGQLWRRAALGFDWYSPYDTGFEDLSTQRKSIIEEMEYQESWAPLQDAWHYEIATRKAKLAAQRKNADAVAVCQDDSAREV